MASQKKTTNKGAAKRKATVQKRIAKQKSEILGLLQKGPIIEIACHKAGISRSTFYRWCEDDYEFADLVDLSKREGTEKINDLAKSKLIEQINQGVLSAIIFWLKCRDREFTEKRHVINDVKVQKPIDKKSKEAVDNVFALFEKKAREVAPYYTASDDDD